MMHYYGNQGKISVLLLLKCCNKQLIYYSVLLRYKNTQWDCFYCSVVTNYNTVGRMWQKETRKKTSMVLEDKNKE